jgi:hypothetical protein
LSFPAAAEAIDPMSGAESAVLQTNGAAAKKLYAALVAVPDALTPWEKRQAECSLARLSRKPSIPQETLSGDSIADEIIVIYRDYWVEAIDRAARPQAEERLFTRLGRVVGRSDVADRDAIITAISEQLNARSIYTASQGKTGALYDLLLYLRQEEQAYKVDLNDGTAHDVTVFLMRNMISLGWARFLTCGGPGTGGFAVETGLFAVAETYDLEGEDFLVSFLLHETRHFADYQRFPGLEGPELEFRAKLTQLSKAEKTLLKNLQMFEDDQSDDRENPHSHANKRVLLALRGELGLRSDGDLKRQQPDAIRAAARALMLKDNAEREQTLNSKQSQTVRQSSRGQ